MILSKNHIEQIHEKKGIDPLPEDYPPMSELIKALGNNTFYLTGDGMHIWEYAKVDGAEGEVIIAIKVASWANDEKSDLTLHHPQLTDVTIKLESDSIDKTAVA